MLSVVTPGTSFQIEAFFTNADGTAFAPNQPVTYNIRDFNNSMVISGSAAQDSTNPQRWYTTISLPSNVVSTADGQYYSLNWLAIGTSTINNTLTQSSQTQNQLFQVAGSSDYLFIESDRLVMMGSPIADNILLPTATTPAITQVSFKDQDNNILYTTSPSNTATVGTNTVFNFSVPGTVTAAPTPLPGQAPCYGWPYAPLYSGAHPFIIEWDFTYNGVMQPPEYHFVYLTTMRVILAMNDLRRMIDKARNADINTNLQYSDIDLIHYLQQGMQRLNAYSPQLTNWNFYTLPQQFQIPLTYAAAYEALNAQVLAESVSAFDFNGQSVSLSVDRSPALDSALERMDAYLQNNVPKAKKVWARSGGGTGISAGVLGISVGPSTNRIRNAQALLSRMQVLGASANFTNTSW